jgi:hypothetical protein
MHELAAANNFENTPLPQPKKVGNGKGTMGAGKQPTKPITAASPVPDAKGHAQLYFSDGTSEKVKRSDLSQQQQQQVTEFFKDVQLQVNLSKTTGKRGKGGKGGAGRDTPTKRVKFEVPEGQCRNCWRAGKRRVCATL